jgi:hypothetical protein
MALPRSEEIKDLALKFSKQQLSGLAQRGEIDPMTAVMAGMMRDRIVMEEMRQNMPETTVADDVLGAAQQMGQPQPMGQPQDQLAQMQRPVEGQPQMAMMAEGGLASIPFDDSLFGGGYAGGGIIAFEDGGRTLTRRGFRGRPEEDPEEEVRRRLTRRGLRAVDERDAQMVPIAPIDDTAEMAKFARQAQGAGVPMSSTGLTATPTQNILPAPQPGPAAPAVAPPAAQVPTDYLTRLQEMYRAAGVSAEPESAAVKELESDRKALDKSEKEANAMALIMAGLGIAGGESPYALVNLKGAIPALQQLGTDKKEINKLRRDYRKVETDLKLAADARKRGDVKTALDMETRAEDRAIKLRSVVAQEAAAKKPSQFQEMYAAEQADPERFRRFREAFGAKDDNLARQRAADDALAKDLDYMRLTRSKKPEDIQRAKEMKQAIYTRYGVGPGAGGADPLGLFQ